MPKLKKIIILIMVVLLAVPWNLAWAAELLTEEIPAEQTGEVLDDSTETAGIKSESTKASETLAAEDPEGSTEKSQAEDRDEPEEGGLVSVEEPAINPWTNLAGFRDLFSHDRFNGAATFNLPFNLPRAPNQNALTPNVNLTYNSYTQDRLSPYGYGWDLSLNSVSRLANKGIDKIYTQDEFSFRLGGKSSELAKIGSNIYMPKLGNDLTKYYYQSGYWYAVDTSNTYYYFGQNFSAQQADPEDSSKVFQWLLERVVDVHGNEISYTYFQDHNQIYPETISYNFKGSSQPLYRVKFNYLNKSVSASSYQTQFKVETFKLFSSLEIQYYNNGWNTQRTYSFTYDKVETAIPLLVSIAQSVAGETLPPIDFSYHGSGPSLNLLQNIDNNRGGIITLEYLASTAYQKDNTIANPLPFIVKTLEKIEFYDETSGNFHEEHYEYFDGHYFIDYVDIFGREYAGFHEVIKYEPERTTKSYFHQSQFSTDGTNQGEHQDHISKKSRLYRQELYDGSDNLIETQIIKWIKKDLGDDRYYVLADRVATLKYDGRTAPETEATEYQYDDYANVIEEKNWGRVTVNENTGEITSDITANADGTSDNRRLIKTFAQQTTLVTHPTTQSLYDSKDQLVAYQEYYYDGYSTLNAITKGDLTKSRRWNSQTGSYVSTQFSYDDYGNIKIQTAPAGNTTTYHYDSTYYFYPTSITQEGTNDERDLTVAYEYDYALGLPTLITQPNGFKASFSYDGFSRLKEKYISDNDSASSLVLVNSLIYNDTTWPSYTENRVHPTSSSSDYLESRAYFDGFGRTIQDRTEAENDLYSVVDKKYDERGNIAYESLPYFDSGFGFDESDWNSTKPHIQTFYDAKDRPLVITTAVGDNTYIYEGYKTSIFNPREVEKNLYFDPYGNLIQVNEHNNSEIYQTFYSYNSLNLLVKIQDAKNNLRNLNYDSLGRRTSLQDLYDPNNPPGTARYWSFTYDDNDNLISQTDPENQTITYDYDEFNRLKKEYHEGVLKFSYAYSIVGFSRGLPIEITAPETNITLNYDTHGNVISEIKTIIAESFNIDFDFDYLDRLRKIIYPSGLEIYYSYNNAGLLETIDCNGTGCNDNIITAIDYAPTSQIELMQYGNSVAIENTYDENELYRLRYKKSYQGSTYHQNLEYSYDEVGNILTIEDRSNTDLKRLATYGYDDLSRLTSAYIYYYNLPTKTYNQNFTYDALGNIISKSDVGSYTYAGGNQGNPQAATSIGTTNLSYDKNGNLLSDGTRNLTYDYRDLINSLTTNGETTTYFYDHTGQRVLKNSPETSVYYVNQYYEVRNEGDNQKTYSYIYADQLKIAALESLTSFDEDGDGYRDTNDCNDHDASIYPGAPEICGDGLDQDCSGADLSCDDVDNDSDGYTENAGDCDDINPLVNPGMEEITYNGVDDDCDAATLDDDLDQDGYEAIVDCNDTNAAVNPGASEIYYNDLDDDCDSSTPDDDLDQDGYPLEEDCDDENIAVNPNQTEIPYNSLDDDCNPQTPDDDLDFDSYNYSLDCNDSDPTIYPNAPEICGDGLDQDCSGADLSCDDVDNDSDGYTENAGDCDDTNPLVNPGLEEITYNGVDDDCDSSTPDDDLDQDGYLLEEDCNDVDPLVNPGASEICWNRVDEDCDGRINNSCLKKPSLEGLELVIRPLCSTYNLNCPFLENVLLLDKESEGHSEKSRKSVLNQKASPTTYNLYYYLSDHLGSTQVVLKTSGEVVQMLDYQPFGTVQVDQQFASYESPYTFTGKERDEESGLIYFEARYYGDTWGRFTSQDPVVLAIGTPSLKEKTGQELFNFLSNPQNLNSYAYVRNNPLRLVDPDGEWFKEVITGKQSWNDFVVEIGDAGNYLYNDSKLAKTIMDHPYATGVVTGVAGGVAAEGGAAAIGAFSEAYLGGAGMGCVAWCGKVMEEGVEVLGTRRDNLLYGVENEKLRNIINDLYRKHKPGTKIIGDGGAIDAYRYTKETGELVGGSDHIIKMEETFTRLTNLLKNNLSNGDRQKAKWLFNNITDTLKGGGMR